MNADESTQMPATFAEYVKANLEQSDLRDVASHGASGGFSGFIYYTETIRVYEAYKAEIWSRLSALADDMGEPVGQVLGEMLTRNGVEDEDQFANLMAWFMLEEYANEHQDEEEESDEGEEDDE